MFKLFKRDPRKPLQQAYEAKLKQAMESRAMAIYAATVNSPPRPMNSIVGCWRWTRSRSGER